MGAITGTIDTDALTRLARGEGATRLAEILEEGDRVCLQIGSRGPDELPFELRAYELPDDDDDDDDDGDDDRGYYVYAGDARAVAIAHREVPPVRWTYVGKGHERGTRAALFTDDYVRDWHHPWREPAIAAAAGGAIRVVAWSERTYVNAILLDGGDTPVALYAGFDAGDAAVALVLDACGLGGLRDDRDGRELFHASQRALAASPLGPHALPARHRFDDFLPNLAPGVPRFDDDEFFAKLRDITATLAGTIPLPNRALGLHAGSIVHHTWPAAGDRVSVFAFVDGHGDLAAWMLRVDGAEPVAWRDLGFPEDCCSLGDAGGAADCLAVVDGGWPRGIYLGFSHNAAGAPLVCISGPDLTACSGAVAFDAAGHLVALVAIS